MIQAKATENTTELTMYVTTDQIATNLHRIVRHVACRLIQECPKQCQKDIAVLLAQGMAMAVREAYTEAKEGGNE